MKLRTLALLLLAGCDAKPPTPKPVVPMAVFGLKAKVTNPASGEFKDHEWSVPAGELAGPARRREPLDFKATKELRVIEVTTFRPGALIFKVASDGKRFAVLKGGEPFHELNAADEAKAVDEALDFLMIQAAREFFANP